MRRSSASGRSSRQGSSDSDSRSRHHPLDPVQFIFRNREAQGFAETCGDILDRLPGRCGIDTPDSTRRLLPNRDDRWI